MIFDPAKLNRAVQHRIAQVKVNELKAMYPESDGKEDLYITVRGVGLGGIMQAREESSQAVLAAITAVQQALTTLNPGSVTEAIQDLKHLSKEARYHFYIVLSGCIDPVLEEADVAHIAEFYPSVILRLSNKIQELTGAGPESKKNLNISGTQTPT